MTRADWNRRQMSNYLHPKNLCSIGVDGIVYIGQNDIV